MSLLQVLRPGALRSGAWPLGDGEEHLCGISVLRNYGGDVMVVAWDAEDDDLVRRLHTPYWGSGEVEFDRRVVVVGRFLDLKDAVNVLKHGEGDSYKRLLERGEASRFKVKQPDQRFFHEGDVSEVTTLVQVDDAFIREATDVIREVVACVEHLT